MRMYRCAQSFLTDAEKFWICFFSMAISFCSIYEFHSVFFSLGCYNLLLHWYKSVHTISIGVVFLMRFLAHWLWFSLPLFWYLFLAPSWFPSSDKATLNTANTHRQKLNKKKKSRIFLSSQSVSNISLFCVVVCSHCHSNWMHIARKNVSTQCAIT